MACDDTASCPDLGKMAGAGNELFGTSDGMDDFREDKVGESEQRLMFGELHIW